MFKNRMKASGHTIYLTTNLSIYLAWFIISTAVPNIGFIQLGYTQITYLAAVIVIATFHLGFIGNISTGLFFGLSSWFGAFIMGIPKYQLFDLAVLPRVETALIIYLLFYIFRVFKKPAAWKLVLLGVLSTMLNQYLVLLAQFLREKITGAPIGTHGVPPIHIWIITHHVNVIAEPILGGAILFAIYPALIGLREQNKNTKLIYY